VTWSKFQKYLCHSQHSIFLPKGEIKLKRNISSLMVKSFVQEGGIGLDGIALAILPRALGFILMIIK